jgi:hypothetical protein
MPAPGRWYSDMAARTGGQPLPTGLARGIERLSGVAMDDVRVHYGSHEPARVQAHAFTRGRTIHVAPGQEQHLPHEAWHVVQQSRGRVHADTQMRGIGLSTSDSLEREADTMGARAASSSSIAMPGSTRTNLARPASNHDSAPIQRKVGFEFQCRNLGVVELKKNKKEGTTTETPYKPDKGAAHAMTVSPNGWYLTSDGGEPEFVVEPAIEEGENKKLATVMNSMTKFAKDFGKKDIPLSNDKGKLFKVTGLEDPLTADPQITAGIAYGRLLDLYELLAARDPKRGSLTNANALLMQNKKVKHYTGDDIQLGKVKKGVEAGMSNPPAQRLFARMNLTQAEQEQAFGVLTLIAGYLTKALELGHAYIKDFPLLAKTDMATIVANSPLGRFQFDEDDISVLTLLVMVDRSNTREQIYDAKKLDSKNPDEDGPTIKEWTTGLFSSGGNRKDLLSYRANRHFADNSMGNFNKFDRVGPDQSIAAPILEFRRINESLPLAQWGPFASAILTWITGYHADLTQRPPDLEDWRSED